MKTLIALSDTHGNKKSVDELLPLIEENDYVVHLGDGFADFRDVFSGYPKKAYLCGGNCDFFSALPAEGVLEIEQTRILYCHGHRYGVKGGLARLAYRAKELDCTVALYGHTHQPSVQEMGGVTLVNPGSLRFPLHQGGSYAYLVINGEKTTAVIVGNSLQ